jgi:mRNA-degrading endonuclease toxin of MazEF toxin-antitoxin module
MAKPSELWRGDVWSVDFGPPIGQHPAVLVSRTAAMRRRWRAIVALISSTEPYGLPTEVAVGPEHGLEADCWVDCEDLFTPDIDLLVRRVGRLDGPTLARVDAGLRVALDLP